jgi:DNA-binding CsgD family transcriptional regulator
MNRDEGRALEVIGRIYDASVDPSLWTDVMGFVVSFVGGSKGLLFASHDPADDDGFAVPYGLDEATVRQLRDSHLVNSLWSRTAVETGLLEDRRSAARGEAAGAPALYREFMGNVGSGRVCTGVAFAPRGGWATACTVFRSEVEPPFDKRERERMRILVPHLARAVEVMDRLRQAEHASTAAEASLDRIACGVVLLGSQGEVLFANQAARRIIEEGDGIHLVEKRGAQLRRRLAFDDARVRAEVDAVLEECLKPEEAGGQGSHQHGAVVRRPSGRSPYLLRCASLAASERLGLDHEGARAIAFITDPEEGASLDRHVLKQLYRLTDSEAALAELLCGGERLADAAVILGITPNTARAHLKNIFHKTGVSRQPELVKVLFTLSAYR